MNNKYCWENKAGKGRGGMEEGCNWTESSQEGLMEETCKQELEGSEGAGHTANQDQLYNLQGPVKKEDARFLVQKLLRISRW